jgi:protein-S-isoprenylcysteine O-methyltransferase Ste14
MVLAALLGAGSLLLFGIFIIIGPVGAFRLDASEPRMLLWDGLLSMVFFVQHSGMVRASFQSWLSSSVPGRYHPSLYAIASGLILTAVLLLWQTTEAVLYRLEGPLRWLPRAVSLLAAGGFLWGFRALGFFDAFGLVPLTARSRGQPPRPPRLVVSGPYRRIRHPLYFFTIVLIWSVPEMTSDRLLFNSLWSLWIVLAAFLEERDLVAVFGEQYRNYQKTVPMFIPWRGRAGRRL